jgi:hydrogenase/urease accessory protein HupE
MVARGILTTSVLGVVLLSGLPAGAHRLAPSLLELRERSAGAVELVWKQALLQPSGASLQPDLPPHCAPPSAPQVERDAASATLRGTLACGSDGSLQAGASALVGATVGVRGLRESGTAALLRVELGDGRHLAAVLDAERPSFTIPARQRALDVAADYLRMGFAHILAGLDHLLFVTGLVLLAAGRRALLVAVTAFSVGHSLTLSLAVLGFVGIPPALAEIAIAASILVLAVELVPGRDGSALQRRPWAAAGCFGLVHGLGFAGALTALGLPQGEIPLALLSFNAGIELGQLVFVAALALGAAALRPALRGARGWLAYAPAYALGSVAAFWCFERVARLL